MAGEMILYRALTEFNFWETKTASSYAYPENRMIQQHHLVPEILFITSWPSRECGIATYTQDLVRALSNQFENTFDYSICALETNSEQPVYKNEPKFKLNTDQPASFHKIALDIRADSAIKLVVVQHEFGFYAAQEESYKYLYSNVPQPIVFVFHTVLPNPNTKLKTEVQEMDSIASSIIVMTENASQTLQTNYGVSPEKITVIPHGTHLISPVDRKKVKKQYELSHRKVLTTFGLLGYSKSIETTLEALPSVVNMHPDILFLVLGKTHPSLILQEGEKYREFLKAKVIELNLQPYVRFVNEYLKLPTLLEYLQLSDIYLFTSKDPNQAVSGTFSYAASCGCPIISTPIPHAKEVLDNNSGIIVDFENSKQLANGICLLLENKALRSEISLNSFQKMASTAWQNSAIAHSILFSKIIPAQIQLNYSIPAISLKHIKKMTTHFGIIQFSKISIPDIQTGYTLDDNARALIALCQHYELTKDANDFALIDTYLQFIKYCLQPNGLFLNYVDEEGMFSPSNFNENLDDSNGRAIWALGYVVSLKQILPINLTNEAEKLMQRAIPQLEKTHSTRAMAFIIKGLHFQNKKENNDLLITFANRLVQMYKHEKSKNWHWFENYLTYGNSSLPEAMLCAYLSTLNTEYKEIAEESFDFLQSKIMVNSKIKVISNKGWHLKDKKSTKPIGGEQPIDVAYTILALEKFYAVFKKEEYKKNLLLAFNWFLGDNHLNQIVYNPSTGGCYDGVEEHNVNLNQGAESTVSYLLARLALERVKTAKKGTYYSHVQKSMFNRLKSKMSTQINIAIE